MAEDPLESNNELYKERAKHHEMAVKQMLRAIIKKAPREILIDVLKSEKIIKRDWLAKGEKYGEK